MDSISNSLPNAFKAPNGSADNTKEAKDTKLRNACADFEAIMLRQLLSAMRKTVPQSGIINDSHAREMYQSMQDEQLANTMAHGKGMGFGEALYQQIARQTGQGGPTK
jgi:peptidoglycan hydrolase FlgJ